MIRNAPAKPLRGEYDLARKARRQDVVSHERKEMQAALDRDGRKCRWPRCPFRNKLKADPAHLQHRGMGGNPRKDRTTRDSVIALCRRHHDLFDRGELEIEPLTAKGTDGPCEFAARDESGTPRLVALEKYIGVSVERSL